MKTAFPFAAGVAVLVAGCATVREPAFDTLIAHRGESVDAPENTLPAYRTAVERGFGFECDIYLSKDKRLFTFHDGTLTRTTAGACSNACTEASWEETVSKVNVGGWGKWKGSEFDPTRPALFSEVLALARDGRYVYVEVKGCNPSWVPYIKAEVESVEKVHPGNVLFISFSAEVCAELKRQMPDYRVYLLTGWDKGAWDSQAKKWVRQGALSAAEVIERVRACGADGVDIAFNPKVHDAEFIRKVHAAGLGFHVWTVDDLGSAKQAFAAGADTLTTNCAKKILDGFTAN